LRNTANTNKNILCIHVDIIHGAALADDDYSGSWDW